MVQPWLPRHPPPGQPEPLLEPCSRRTRRRMRREVSKVSCGTILCAAMPFSTPDECVVVFPNVQNRAPAWFLLPPRRHHAGELCGRRLLVDITTVLFDMQAYYIGVH